MLSSTIVDRVHIAGCPVDCINLDELTEKLCQAIARRDYCQVLGVNAAFIVDAYRHSGYKEILESTTFVPADGFWVAFAAKVLGYSGVGHVDIERLVYRLFERLANMGSTVYLLGAREGIVKKAATTIEDRYKGIKVVGVKNGYFNETDEEEILSHINRLSPDLILVGMTSPKKERWMSKYRNRLRTSVVIGVGGLFDVLAGQVSSAPEWVKNHGLEWLFRLAHDPKRLWKRYTLGNAQFICLIFREWVRTAKYFQI